MLRLSTLKATLFTISRKNKLKVLKIINLLLFVTFFALISSSASIYFERKIDEIEKKNIISEFNNLIFSNQIERTSSNIKFTERILDKYYETDSFLHILYTMSSSDLNFYNEREKYYDMYFLLRDRAITNNSEMQRSLGDAMMISDKVEDIEKIEKYNDIYIKLDQKLSEIFAEKNLHEANNSPPEDASKNEYNRMFLGFERFNKKLIDLLIEQSDFFLSFNTKFFNDKKNEAQIEITKSLERIQFLSKKETQFILFAFLIQVIIFVTVQIFELTFEYQSRNKKK
tara:strand:- start:1939 stop:2793 length:855 start_codon:yes stop_codon:yes gene_type:complete